MLPEQQQRIMGYFIEEAKDHLNTIEQGLLSLQTTIEDSEKANEIFRAAHSVKGGAAMLGLESIQKTAHRMEDYFKVLKEATVRVDHTLETMFLRISDGLKDLLEQLEGPFGLTQEKAQEIMAGVDPVFGQLEAHLNKLVAQSGEGAEAGAPVAKEAYDSSAMQASFKQDVATLLREMLSTFKQPDTAETRRGIQDICAQLMAIGKQYDLPEWCDLVETARLAAASEANDYRVLAPILIKEIKKSQDLVLAGRASEVAVSDAMQALLPEDILAIESEGLFESEDVPEEDISEANLFEDDLFAESPASGDDDGDFDELFSPEVDTDVDAFTFDAVDSVEGPTDEPALDNEFTLDLSHAEPEAEEAPIGRLNIDLDFNEIPSELSALNRNSESEEKADESLDALLATVNVTGPDVGADELNSLADLFDGDLDELDNTLGSHPFVSEEMRLHPEKIDLDEEDDLTDLLGSEIANGLSSEPFDAGDDAEDDLFGGTLTDGGFATDSDLDADDLSNELGFDMAELAEGDSLESEQAISDSSANDELTEVTEDIWGTTDDDELFGIGTDELLAVGEADNQETTEEAKTESEAALPNEPEQTLSQPTEDENIDEVSFDFEADEFSEISFDEPSKDLTLEIDGESSDITEEENELEQSLTGTPAVSLFSDEHVSPSEQEIEFPTLTGVKLEEAEKDIDSFFLGIDEEENSLESRESDEVASEQVALASDLPNEDSGATDLLSQMSDDPWGELAAEPELATTSRLVENDADALFLDESALDESALEELVTEQPSESVAESPAELDDFLSDDFLSDDVELSFDGGLDVDQAEADLEDLLVGEGNDNASELEAGEKNDDLWNNLADTSADASTVDINELEATEAATELNTTEEELPDALNLEGDSDQNGEEVTEDDETHFSDSFINVDANEADDLFSVASVDSESDDGLEGDEAITTFSNLLPSEIDALVESKEELNRLGDSSEIDSSEIDSSELDIFETDLFETDESEDNEAAESDGLGVSLEESFTESSIELPEAESIEDIFGETTDSLTEDSSSEDIFSIDLENADLESADLEIVDLESTGTDVDSLESLLNDNFLELGSEENSEPNADGNEALETTDSFESLESLLEEEPPITSGENAELNVPNDAQAIAEVSDTFVDGEADSADDEDFGDLERLLDDGDSERVATPTVSRRAVPRSPRRTGGGVREQNMRVPVKHLDNLSNLVGELVVSRNTLESDQERLRQFLDNLLFQVQQLNDVGQRMRDLYERSLLESSLVSNRRAHAATHSAPKTPEAEGHATGATFDALEMDRFTGFHTLSQEMIELIVRVRESSSDIGYTVESSDQVTRQFRQITTQLQEGLNTARMVAFSQAADRLPRAVRDISLKCGKQARLAIEGKDTLIDKMIVEHLYDPLTHLVNNAITHGIETPEDRQAAGKSPEGTITVQAFYQGNQTVIYVADDGGGINAEFVKRKAIEKKLLTQAEADELSDIEAYELIFHAGFSTRDQADDFAGRGVGMDVVRTSLAEIRGAITIDSELGKGTGFTIRLPLTLSISKALSCVSNQARIAFPMDGVEDMLDVPRDRVVKNEQGQDCIRWRDGLLPFQTVTELLKFNRTLGRGRVYGGSQDDDVLSIIVLRSANTFVAVQVDQVIGEEEIVIKQLEGPVPKPLGIAGATILGDGRVMPIADVLELIDIAMGRIRREPASMLWAEVPAEEAPVKSDPTVLIVDDSITVRELLSMSFNKVGYRVEQARDGQEAWDKLRSGLPCDLVFCDIEMPRMDGLELLSRMQKDNQLRHVPIAMLTSRGADRHRQMAVDLGASGYFTKPYLEEALLDAAQRMLNGESLTKGRGG